MKIALIGVTGNVGTRLLAELLNRGHEVTGIARDPAKVAPQPGLTLKKADVANPSELAGALKGNAAVVHSVHFLDSDPHKMIAAAKEAEAGRLLVVGGAGSLEVAPGVRLVDTPDFPEAYKAESLAGADFLDVLRGETELAWTFLSPSAYFIPGERTGKFRLGGDQLLVDGKGESKISYEDFAIALVDELESPVHLHQRFTIGY